MSKIPKHEGGQPKKRKSKQLTPDSVNVVLSGPATDHGTPSMQHDINHVAGLGDVEASLDWIAKGIGRLTDDNNGVNLSLSTGYKSEPVKVTLAVSDYDETMDRFVTALERIADAVAKLAGLSRPRLESWHEQDEYEPRYKDTACDGGAPGPKTT